MAIRPLKQAAVFTEADTFARELIRMSVASLRDLNGGRAPPQRWRDWIETELGPKTRRGAKPNKLVVERQQAWAREMLRHRIAIDEGTTTETVTEAAKRLADAKNTGRQRFTSADVFNAERGYKLLAMSEQIGTKLLSHFKNEQDVKRARGLEIQCRLDAGDSLDDILNDPELSTESYIAIRDHQERGTPFEGAPVEKAIASYEGRAEAISRWLAFGLALGVGNDPPEVVNLNRASREGLLPDTPGRKRSTRT